MSETLTDDEDVIELALLVAFIRELQIIVYRNISARYQH